SYICFFSIWISTAGNSGAARFIGVTNPRLNWSQAQTYCRTYYTDLASALTQADNDLLAQIVSVQGYSWFGLYRETWKWLNGTVASNLQWNPGKPNNAKPQENCGVLINGLFSDERCTSVHYFFCEFTQQTTHLFFINQAVSWPDAQKYCRTKYPDLARVKDPSVLVELNKMAASRGLTLWPLWIGLYNDFYNWRWSFNNISQTSTNLTLWYPGEPDNYVGHESCGGVYVAGNWADWDCALQKPFICYSGEQFVSFCSIIRIPV
ncbi:lectin C-type domain containing isoform 1 precursor, partial [Silurus meridionalis]